MTVRQERRKFRQRKFSAGSENTPRCNGSRPRLKGDAVVVVVVAAAAFATIAAAAFAAIAVAATSSDFDLAARFEQDLERAMAAHD